MNYHDLRTDDMLNGSGLRVVLFVSGCDHKCKECQNPQTWDYNSGEKFDKNAYNELISMIDKDYIKGLTLSGGDPLNKHNIEDVLWICQDIKYKFPNKNIWLYTGYEFEQIKDLKVLKYIDVLVDGKYDCTKNDINYEWAGSTNQKIIDVQKTLKVGKVVLWKN